MGSLIRVESGQLAGYGHLSRARALRSFSPSVRIVNRGSEQDDCINLCAQDSLLCEVENLPDGDLIILDFSCDPVLNEGKKKAKIEVQRYLAAVKEKFKKVFLIDGLSHGSLIQTLVLSESDIQECLDRLIVPYPLNNALKKIGAALPGSFFYGGLEYFLFGKNFLNRRSNTGNTACKDGYILVSFGGSDPWHMTEAVLGLAADLGSYSFKVIEGPAFNRRLQSSSAHIEVLRAQTDLAPLIDGASWLITYPGLTRYESAFLGVPSMVVSPNAQWQELNQGFMEQEMGVDLGVVHSVSKECIGEVLKNDDLCTQLSNNAKKRFSGYSLELIKKVYLDE